MTKAELDEFLSAVMAVAAGFQKKLDAHEIVHGLLIVTVAIDKTCTCHG